jgi:hypothetical protein
MRAEYAVVELYLTEVDERKFKGPPSAKHLWIPETL